jgi:hypothetical protein
VDPALQRLAERRILSALARLHRRDPLRADQRTDAVLAELRADPAENRPAGHRGSRSLRGVPDQQLLAVIDSLVFGGTIERSGHRIRQPGHAATIRDPEMAARVETLLSGLRAVGVEVPRVEALSARLGIPPGVIQQLRAAGVLVRVADGIDYPSDVLAAVLDRVTAMAATGPLNVARVRNELRASRRTAEALLDYRRAQRARRAGPRSAPGPRSRGSRGR